METLPLFGTRPGTVQAPGGGVPSWRGPSTGSGGAPRAAGAPGHAVAPGPAAAGRLAVDPFDPTVDPQVVHPALWRAHQLGRACEGVCPSGFALLDAELPGGGWPQRALTELLLPHPGVGEMRLLAPTLAALQRAGRCAMWFDPPAEPCAAALAACGVDPQQLVVVRARDGRRGRARERLPAAADTLWALEQALKSGHVGAVLAWLPRHLPAEALRRLQLAAQAHDGPAFVLRESEARTRPSAAPLRLLLGVAGPDELLLRVLKRRGPPSAQPLRLPLPPVLAAPGRRRAARGSPVAAAASPPVASRAGAS
ncbi:MAG: translesion DNA synthesis-associated protein ImuA [Rubrivivax sp.]|nr:translesion DNA synthesis-associated protein ImuA [Rubrivivax sp.]